MQRLQKTCSVQNLSQDEQAPLNWLTTSVEQNQVQLIQLLAVLSHLAGNFVVLVGRDTVSRYVAQILCMSLTDLFQLGEKSSGRVGLRGLQQLPKLPFGLLHVDERCSAVTMLRVLSDAEFSALKFCALQVTYDDTRLVLEKTGKDDSACAPSSVPARARSNTERKGDVIAKAIANIIAHIWPKLE